MHNVAEQPFSIAAAVAAVYCEAAQLSRGG
jgi:hypothetical protein